MSNVKHVSKIWFNDNPWRPLEIATYPGGEVRIGEVPSSVSVVEANIADSDGIQALWQLADLLRRRELDMWGNSSLQAQHVMAVTSLPKLVLRYVPYARQDRVDVNTVYNQAHSLKVFATQLNAMGWAKVEMWDPHSDVAPALIDNSSIVTRADLVYRAKPHLTRFKDYELAMVIPDQGAIKASRFIAQLLNVDVVCQGEKVRDMRTGQITGTFVNGVDSLAGRVVLIADDICDGGRTFTELAKYVRSKTMPEAMVLYVTHGIFSQGIDVLLEHFDMVICPNVFGDVPAGIGQVCTHRFGIPAYTNA